MNSSRNQDNRRRRRKKKNGIPKKVKFFTLILALVGIGVLVYALSLSHKPAGIDKNDPSGSNPGSGKTSESTTSKSTKPTEPEPIKEVNKITIANMGDILIHTPVLSAAYDSKTNSYNFDDIFTYYEKYSKSRKYSFSTINLEVTLAGTRVKYDGYPGFNSPDSLIDAALKGGFNMMTTANNHAYDTGSLGMHRTMQVLKEKGVIFNGTRPTEDEKQYVIPEIGGIKVGMITYTYETEAGDRKALNGITVAKSDENLINSFSYSKLNSFYAELAENFKKMKKEGAKATVIYIHWGNEYSRTPNSWQKQIAKKICDIGFDVIVGGHPHVVQPIEIIESETTGKQTVCIYSMGNSVSNQRIAAMTTEKTGHTEDGVIFEFELTQYSDGDVRVSNIDAVPTWVYLHSPQGKGRRAYQILPLDKSLNWKSEYSLSDAVKKNCDDSYNRTMALVGAGLENFKTDYTENQKSLG